MSTRSKRVEAVSRYSHGTLVSVQAGCFDADDKDADGDDCWSSKFPNGSQQELYGVIEKSLATRCDVYFFYDKMTTKVDLEKIIVKEDQQTVILEDGTECRREGFCTLVSLDGEKLNKRLVSKKSGLQSASSDMDMDTAFTFEPDTPLRIRNQNMGKRKASPDSIVLTMNPKRPTCEIEVEPNDPSTSSVCEILPVSVPVQVVDQKGECSTLAPPDARRTRVKKLPIYKRPVKNLSEAEKEENYESACQDNSNEKTVTSVIKEAGKKDGKVRTLHFSTKKKKQVRRSKCDIVIGKPGPTMEAKSLVKPEQAFDYYFPSELQKKLVSFINKRIVHTLRKEARCDDNIGSSGDPEYDSDSEEEPDEESGENVDDPADKVATWPIKDDREPEPEHYCVGEDIPEQPDLEMDHSEEGDQATNRVMNDLKELVEEDYVLSEQDNEFALKFPSRKRLVNVIEFRAFLGLWLLRGLWGQGTARLGKLFSPDGMNIFSATMSRERFKWIMRHLSFDGVVSTEERKARWKHDRLAAIRYMFEVVVDRWARPMVPDVYLTIDETLYNLYTQVLPPF